MGSHCSYSSLSAHFSSVHFSSVTQSCLTPCDPVHYRKPGFPVLHHLPELAQTHVHWVGDATQPSHPLSSPSPPALNFSNFRVFSNESALHIRRPKYWSFTFSLSPSHEYSGLISFRIDWFSLQSKGSQESSPTPWFNSINSSVLSFHYSPTLISTRDHWKTIALTRWTLLTK